MIETGVSWKSIFHQIGMPFPERRRPQCPFCESRTGFSIHEEKGFHCFACGVKGDKISFIQQLHKCSFKNTLRFFGIEPGQPHTLDSAIEHRRKINQGLKRWVDPIQHQLRDDYYHRSRCEVLGKKRLQVDSEDPIGWELLSIAYIGKPLEELEKWLDLLIGTEEQQLKAYIMMRKNV